MIQNLQALRAVAALLVVFMHLELLLATVGLPKFGHGGVDLFFVISGFVMVSATRGRRPTPVDFMKNRIARIVPIYWLMTLAVFTLGVVAPSLLQSTSADPALLLKSLFFIPFQRADGLVQPLLFVGWTLNYEMFFYAFFALGLALPRYLLGLGVTAALILALVVLGVVFEPQTVLARFYTNAIMLEFMIGMGLALLINRVPNQAGRAAKAAVLAVVVVCLAAVVIVPLLKPGLSGLLSAGLPATFAVFGALALERWGWRIESRLWLALGDASYILYLSHPFVTQMVQKLGMKLAPQGLMSFALIGLAFLLVCITALILYRLVEKPLSDAARRLLLPPRPQTAR